MQSLLRSKHKHMTAVTDTDNFPEKPAGAAFVRQYMQCVAEGRVATMGS